MSVPRSEQETIIRWSADADVVHVYTAHPPTHRKLARAGYRPYRVTMHGSNETRWFYRIPVGELRWRVGAKRRQTSQAQRDQLARGRVARNSLATARETEVKA